MNYERDWKITLVLMVLEALVACGFFLQGAYVVGACTAAIAYGWMGLMFKLHKRAHP